MAKDFFNAYHSYLKSMETLTDAECGRLFRACLNYSKFGTEPELRGNERFVFPMVRQQIDIDVEASKVKSETNRNNALRRYAMAGDGMRSYANPCEDQRLPAREKEENEEKERSSPCSPSSFPPHPPIITPYNPPKEKEAREERESCAGRPVDVRFEQFWQAYPKKVGKKDALKAFERAKPTAELFSKMLEAIEIAKKSPGWQRGKRAVHS